MPFAVQFRKGLPMTLPPRFMPVSYTHLFFRVCHLSVDDAPFLQGFPDGDGVDVVKTVLFFFGIEPVLLNELGKPALYLRPGQLRFLRAAGTDNEQAVAVTAADVYKRQVSSSTRRAFLLLSSSS